MKNNCSYLLVSEEGKCYTFLHRFDQKRKSFEGEYSILHNEYTKDSVFLSKFLLAYKSQPLIIVGSDEERYQEITSTYHRFLEEDIVKYVGEKVQKEFEKGKDLEMDRGLGQLQLSIVKQMVEKQLEDVQKQNGKTPADHQVLLGKELSLQWMIHMINDVVEKGKY